jgi:hypothetical protein
VENLVIETDKKTEYIIKDGSLTSTGWLFILIIAILAFN